MMKKIFVVIFSLILVSVSCFPAFAVYYDDTFPTDETGLTGGLFMECSTNIGDIVIVIPYNFKEDTFTFSSTGNVFNATSTSISCAMFMNGNQYTVLFGGFSYPKYRLSDSGLEYSDLVIESVSDTNVVFLSDNEQLRNDNYYLSTFEKIIISLLCVLIFLLFLCWFLLHKK